MMWLQDEYIYRRVVDLSSPVDVSAGSPVTAILPIVMLDNGKIRNDFEDIEVVYISDDATPQNIVLYREVEYDGTDIRVSFNLQDDLTAEDVLSDKYYIYHGNLELTNQVTRPSGSIDEWPITIEHDAGTISYTRPGEHWVDGVSSKKLARANFRFYGSQVRIISDLSFTGGIMEVRVDEDDWEVVDLFEQAELTDQSVFEKDSLDLENPHQVQIKVSNEVNPLSLGFEVNIKSIEYRKPVIVTDLGEEVNDVVWATFTGGS